MQANARVHHNKLLVLNFWLLIRSFAERGVQFFENFYLRRAEIRNVSPIRSEHALCTVSLDILSQTDIQVEEYSRDVASRLQDQRVLLVRFSRGVRPLFLGAPRPCMVHTRERTTSEPNHPPGRKEQIFAH